jgi:hypothetical protein
MPPLKEFEFVHSLNENVRVIVQAYSLLEAMSILRRISQDSYKLIEK